MINQKNLKHNLCTMSKLQLMSLNYTNDRRHALSFKHLGSLKNVLVFHGKLNLKDRSIISTLKSLLLTLSMTVAFHYSFYVSYPKSFNGKQGHF